MKLTVILIIALAISIAGGVFFFGQYRNERENRKRNQDNVEILAKEFQQFRDSSAAQVHILRMTANEINRSFPALVSKIESMDIKLKNVDQVTTTETVVNQTFKTHIRDSLNTVVDTVPLKYMKYKDAWIDFEAQQINNDLYVTRNLNRVPLFQVAHWEKPGAWKPKNLLPWNWRTKELVQDISTDNPHAKIEFSRTIQMQK